MEASRAYEPEFDSFKELLLDMAQERSPDSLLRMIVERLAARPHVALVRVWLVRPGDVCDRCPMRAECPGHVPCLHLVASAGHPQGDPDTRWSRLDGEFARFPIGARKVGRIAATGEAVMIERIDEDPGWIVHPDWAKREGIVAFHGQPLAYKGQVLGVLAAFLRIPVPKEGPVWTRLVADHVAAALANAQAFEEVERLRKQLELENEYLREEVSEALAFGDLVGGSSALRSVAEQIELVAPTDANVLILGESGTGKELVAREIHKRSRRADRPLVKVNCASIPRELYESEFFGHVRGSFTGAVRDRIGRFELADGGTLFLDEVGEIPLELQGKLLRVLQEGTYERVGDERTRKVNTRIVAATNRDLKQEMEAGRFRQDLYYRLNVFPIEVAPLRQRPEDIPLLAEHFLSISSRKLGCSKPRLLTQAALLKLQRYGWPGNVRELQNVIERAVISARCGELRFDLPDDESTRAPEPRRNGFSGLPPGEVIPDVEIRRRERENILAALERSGWKVYGEGGAAELLGIKATTLASRLKKLKIERPSPPVQAS